MQYDYINPVALWLALSALVIGGGWTLAKVENYLRGRKRGGQ